MSATQPSPEIVRDDHRFAAWAAARAGDLLEEVRGQGLTGRDLKAAGDRLSHEFLLDLLRTHRPGDAVLSEEGMDDKARLDADRVWIIDPVDGTREYSEPPRSDWAVHVALWEAGELVAGAVAKPSTRLRWPETHLALLSVGRGLRILLLLSQRSSAPTSSRWVQPVPR